MQKAGAKAPAFLRLTHPPIEYGLKGKGSIVCVRTQGPEGRAGLTFGSRPSGPWVLTQTLQPLGLRFSGGYGLSATEGNVSPQIGARSTERASFMQCVSEKVSTEY